MAVSCARHSKQHNEARPVIAVTAWSMGGYVQRAHEAGCDSVLVKPCLPEDLLVEIQRLLKLSTSTSKM